MEQFGIQHNEFDLGQLLIDYEEAIKNLPSEAKLTCRQVLKVLRARDRVQDALQVLQLDDEYLAKLVELDLDLKQKSGIICNAENLRQLRQSFQPPESSWWWHLEPPAEPSHLKPLSDKFDWLWNVGTVACLVLATSFITQTAKIFSNEGFDFLGTLSTISQGAGLAFVASGALTDRGKQAVAKTLNTIKVPASLHAEVTFGASLVLLGAAYGINQNSPLVGNWYFDQAQHHEAQGEWSQAFKSYKRALNFAPDDYKTQIAFGFLYEKLGSFDQAVEEYKKGTAFGIPEFLNAQARAMLMGGFQKNSWQGGIDSKIIHEAEDLLERAEKSTLDLSRSLGKTRKNRRLYADIKINQAIAQMAKIKFKEKLDETTKNSLNKIVDRLISINESVKQDQSEEQNVLTATSTLGKTIGERLR
jgi:tetratricopeptide (TPR) repeat protein